MSLDGKQISSATVSDPGVVQLASDVQTAAPTDIDPSTGRSLVVRPSGLSSVLSSYVTNSALTTALSGYVSLAGNETISGTKTFTSHVAVNRASASDNALRVSIGVEPFVRFIITADGIMYAGDGTASLLQAANPFLRKLYDNSGMSAIDWTVRQTYDALEVPTLDWDNRILYGGWTFNGTTTIVNSTELAITDRLVHVNHSAGPDAPTPTALAGLAVHRGDVSGVDRDHQTIAWDDPLSTFVLASTDSIDNIVSYSDLHMGALTLGTALTVANGGTGTTDRTLKNAATDVTVDWENQILQGSALWTILNGLDVYGGPFTAGAEVLRLASNSAVPPVGPAGLIIQQGGINDVQAMLLSGGIFSFGLFDSSTLALSSYGSIRAAQVFTQEILDTGGSGVMALDALATIMRRPVSYSITPTTLSSASNITYAATDLLGGLVLRDPNGADRTDTTPTAAQFVSTLGSAVDQSTYQFSIRNEADATETITLAAGTDVTLSGVMVIQRGECREFLAVITDAVTPAVTVYSTGLATQVVRTDVANTFVPQQIFETGATGNTPVVFRQTGGTPGTDEVQISHDGSGGLIVNKDGSLIIRTPTDTILQGTAFYLGDNVGGQYYGYADIAGFRTLNTGQYGFTGTVNAYDANDTGLARSAAGVVKITDGGAGGGTLSFPAATQTQLVANTDNYAPTTKGYLQRWSTDASRDVTGLSIGQVDGQTHRIVNVGSFNIVLKHQTTSTAANQFLNGTGADITLTPNQAADIIYDATTLRWRATWSTVPSTFAFSGITSGTNTTAAMVVGAGSTLAATTTGTITATSVSANAPVQQATTQAGTATALTASAATTGSASGAAAGGAVTITAGAAAAFASGNIGADGGAITLTAGAAAKNGTGSGTGGAIALTTGTAASGGSADTTGGAFTVTTGTGANNGNGGAITFTMGAGSGVGKRADFTVRNGTTAYFTVPGSSCTGTDNTFIGSGAGSNVSTGANNIYIGKNAGLNGGARTYCIGIGEACAVGSSSIQSISIGYTALSSNYYTIAIGPGAQATGPNSTAIGFGAVANTGSYCLAIGDAASSTHNSSIALGAGATTTATNQCVLGGINGAITEFIVGAGPSNTSKQTVTIRTSDGAASTSGSALTIRAGDAATTAALAGGALTLRAGAGVSPTGIGGDGGAASFTTGAGGNGTTTNAGGASGALTLASGVAGTTATGTGGAGGTVSLTSAAGGAASGAGTGGAGGTMTISAGNGGNSAAGTTSGVGGAASIRGGASGTNTTQPSANGGAASLLGGASGTVTTGTSGTGGAVLITAGASGSASGAGTSGTGGDITLVCGSAGGTSAGIGGSGGAFSLTSGSAANRTTGTANPGGSITIATGIGGVALGSNTAGAGGALTLLTSDGAQSITGNGGNAGALSLSTGNGGNANTTGVAGNGGAITITAGRGGSAGGAGTGGNGGALTISAGNGYVSTGGTDGVGGVLTLKAGAGGSASAAGGSIAFQTAEFNSLSTRITFDRFGGFNYTGIATNGKVVGAASEGRLYYDSTLQKFRVSENAGPLTNLLRDPQVGRNKIVNGNFNFWQRGTTALAGTNLLFRADRFQYIKSGSGTHELSRSTVVPTVTQSGVQSSYSLLVDCTGADTDLTTAGDVYTIRHTVEGYNFAQLYSQTFTLTFWVRATKTGIHCVRFASSTADRSYVAEYTISTTDTWEKKTVTVSAVPSGGTWDFTTGAGLIIDWCLGANSSYSTTANAWQSGNYYQTANQVNAVDSTANDFKLAQVQLELGDTASSFEIVDPATELARCQRYYEKNYPLETEPAEGVANGPSYTGAVWGTNNAMREHVSFRVWKRATPTITFYKPVGGGVNGKWQFFVGAWTDSTGTASLEEGGPGFCVDLTHGTLTFGQALIIKGGWTASAEI